MKSYCGKEKNLLNAIQRKNEMLAIERLNALDHEVKLQKYKNVPPAYIPRSKFDSTKANGLATCIITFLLHNGHRAWRQASEGRYRPGQQFVDVLGHVKQMPGTFLPGQNNGAADVCAIGPGGKFIAVEVKIGHDIQSPAQKKYQREVEASGGLYFIVKTFHSFLAYYDEMIYKP